MVGVCARDYGNREIHVCWVIVISVFYDELVSTLIRAEEENIGNDNLVLEINSLK